VLAGRLAQETLACGVVVVLIKPEILRYSDGYLQKICPFRRGKSRLLIWHKTRLSALMKRHKDSVIFARPGARITTFTRL
jgi:hypothetical protein